MIETLEKSHEKLPSEKSFGIVFAAFFSIVGVFPLISGGTPRFWSFVVAGGFLFLAFLSPKALTVPNKIWARFGSLMHKIMEPVILGIVFFLIVTPFGILIRLIGFDLLKLKRSSAGSYWRPRTVESGKENMKFQF